MVNTRSRHPPEEVYAPVEASSEHEEDKEDKEPEDEKGEHEALDVVGAAVGG
jgi:hypothetical protein